MGQATVRKARDLKSNFSILDNKMIRDPRLSWRGLGFLVYLLHLPDDFVISLEHISGLRPGRGSRATATASAAAELVEAGYMAKEYKRDVQGRIAGTIWHVSHIPEFKTPKPENPVSAFPGLGNQGLQSIEVDKELNKQSTTTTTALSDEQVEEVVEASLWLCRGKSIQNPIAYAIRIRERVRLGLSKEDEEALRLYREEKIKAARLGGGFHIVSG